MERAPVKTINTKPDLSSIGARCRHARQKRGMTYAQMRAALPGYSSTFVQSLELNGHGMIGVGNAAELSKILDIRPEWLAFGTGQMSTKFAGPWACTG